MPRAPNGAPLEICCGDLSIEGIFRPLDVSVFGIVVLFKRLHHACAISLGFTVNPLPHLVCDIYLLNMRSPHVYAYMFCANILVDRFCVAN